MRMKKIVKLLYMFLFHPVLFWKYSVQKNSRYFFVNGLNQTIKTRYLKVGKCVRLGNFTRINFYDKGILQIGDGCYIGQRNSFLVGADICVGNEVLMASDICITSENHSMNPQNQMSYGKQPLVIEPVSIGEGCWIGEKVVILPGVTVGKKSIIGAGSIVTKNIPDYCIAVGNPAKVIKYYDFESNQWVNNDR